MRGETVGQMIKRLRVAKGWSQASLAAKTCLAAGVDSGSLTRQDFYRWEAGKRTPREWLPFIAAALEVPLAEMQIAATIKKEDTAPVTLADFLSDTDALQPSQVRQGRRIGATEVADLAARVHSLRLADDVVAGGDLIGRALRDLRSAIKLYRESTYAGDVGRALLVQIGELAQISGWIASDAGRHDEADRIYRIGMSAAKQAEDATLVANLAGSLAYQYSNTGRVTDGLLLARAAWDSVSGDAPAEAKALTLDRLAWAQTKANDSRDAIRTLGQASDALADDANQMPSPNYLYWVNPGELQVMEARVFTELHRPLRAVPQLREVLSRYEVAHVRETALYLSWLAVALADANEPEESAATAERVISLSSDVASERTAARVRVVLDRLEEYRDVPEVRAVLDYAA
ncbi:helix-turn-helix transcriptional regulator [Actinacidiphila acididurans]|uniref:Helix-turn-helix transcriptional regulator n=1 Tax=Actinacidiphila acididurans TaxID=2784346 RepID=A0ABS2TND1_9ACTN|nr:helix-turn-helix transcriptional regulator [Actinacidiphila acididurans]MBM9504511.1 helix-turn-helix transcriptional regulator [Actinacidiphila acididurans]